MIQAMNPKKMKHEKIIDNFFQQNVRSVAQATGSATSKQG